MWLRGLRSHSHHSHILTATWLCCPSVNSHHGHVAVDGRNSQWLWDEIVAVRAVGPTATIAMWLWWLWWLNFAAPTAMPRDCGIGAWLWVAVAAMWPFTAVTASGCGPAILARGLSKTATAGGGESAHPRQMGASFGPCLR